jgi:Tol biopolymer transport system component
VPLTPSGPNGLIAYAWQDRVEQVHVMNADGTADREVAPGTCPTYSRGGTVLTYRTGDSFQDRLMVANPDGSSPRVIPDVGDSAYALSPDGTEIAWFKQIRSIDRTFADGSTAGAGSNDELWVSPVSGGPGHRILPMATDPMAWSDQPTWSPDGRSIAFDTNVTVFSATGAGSYRTSIWAVGVDGSGLHEVTARAGTDDAAFSWSPDSRSIAYLGLPDGSPRPPLPGGSGLTVGAGPDQDVFVIGADGTADHDLTKTMTNETAPEWSPDGSRLAYRTFIDKEYRLVTLPLVGTTAAGSPVIGPGADSITWAPDGSRLLVLHVTNTDPFGPTSTIESVDPAFGQAPVILRSADHAIDCLSWQVGQPNP